jgi:hypothetical protein
VRLDAEREPEKDETKEQEERSNAAASKALADSNDLAREAWLDAFEDQLTKEVIERVQRYAAKRAKLVGEAGGTVGELYVSELVQNAIGDTYTGTLRWDPAGESLESHLMGAVQWRTRDDRRKLAVDRHVSLDAPASEALRSGLKVEQSDTLAISSDIATSSLVRKIERLAKTDRMVRVLLSAFRQGARHRADVLAMTQMSVTSYQAARVRMIRYAQEGLTTADTRGRIP